jgi:hypothetical protein
MAVACTAKAGPHIVRGRDCAPKKAHSLPLTGGRGCTTKTLSALEYQYGAFRRLSSPPPNSQPLGRARGARSDTPPPLTPSTNILKGFDFCYAIQGGPFFACFSGAGHHSHIHTHNLLRPDKLGEQTYFSSAGCHTAIKLTYQQFVFYLSKKKIIIILIR